MFSFEKHKNFLDVSYVTIVSKIECEVNENSLHCFQIEHGFSQTSYKSVC